MDRGYTTSFLIYAVHHYIFHQYLPYQANERIGKNATGRNLLIQNLKQLNTVLGPIESIVNENYLISARIMTVCSIDQFKRKRNH